jgi:tetratricopeptide (TPR) repeat protein
MPPGPRAFFDGKRLLEKGDHSAAIENFTVATSILPTNALAWHFLGVACHQAGRTAEAETAYQRALSCNRDLSEAHYNLGCLRLEQNNLDRAKAEFTSFTLQRPNSVEGFVKLGTVQLRLREFGSAEKSFTDALRLSATNREALNGLGIVRLQRGRPSEAAQLFSASLKNAPEYAPALFNMAVLDHQYFRKPQAALDRFKQYVALKPRPANVEAVSAVLRHLEQELARSTVASVPLTSRPVTPQTGNPNPKPVSVAQTASNSGPLRQTVSLPANSVTATQTAPQSLTSAPTSATPRLGSPPAPSPTTRFSTPSIISNAPEAAKFRQPGQPSAIPSAPAPQIEKLPPEPIIKTADDTAVASTPPASAASPQPSAPAEDKAARRGLLQSLNPLNLFHGADKTPARVTTLPPTAASVPSSSIPSSASQAGQTEASAQESLGPRYRYIAPAKPTAGNRSAADKAFSQGLQAQTQHRLSDAQSAYRKAVQLDPAFFKAHYNLALACTDLAEPDSALREYEVALAIQPDSLDARYNFALLLKQRGYIADAVAELKKVAASPNQTRAHLALGNLYAQQLANPGAARLHYSKVLELDPRHPQAPAIRYWLADHAK